MRRESIAFDGRLVRNLSAGTEFEMIAEPHPHHAARGQHRAVREAAIDEARIAQAHHEVDAVADVPGADSDRVFEDLRGPQVVEPEIAEVVPERADAPGDAIEQNISRAHVEL